MSIAVIVGVTAVMAASAALQGAVGFGLGLIAIPFLIYLDVRFVPAPLLVAAFTLHIFVLRRDRSGVDSSGLLFLLAGRFLGTLPAAALLAILPVARMKILVAILVLAGAIIGTLRSAPRQTRIALTGAGFASGFMATAAGLGGPAVAHIYQHAPGQRLRGTLAAYFFVGTILSLAALAAVGRFGGEELRLSAFLIPGTVLGYFMSRPAAAYLDGGYTRTAVLTVSALTAVSVILTVWL